ncbi:MAG: hypothetical protein K2W94_04375 [Alphaproteobacteria bacterium]|nr:hypothetical protein [Alphaproteobacteria bacterium]
MINQKYLKLLIVGLFFSQPLFASNDNDPSPLETPGFSSSWKAIKSFCRLAEAVYDASNEESREEKIQDILTFVERYPATPYNIDLLEVVYEYYPFMEDQSLLPLMRKIASVAPLSELGKVFEYMVNSNEEDKEFAIHQILTLAQQPDSWRHFEVFSRFLNSSQPSSHSDLVLSTILPIMRKIAENDNDPNQSQAVLDLSRYSLMRKDSEFVRPQLQKMVADTNHPKRIEAALALFSNGIEQDQATVRPVLYVTIENARLKPESRAAYALDIVCTLLYKGNQNDKAIAEQVLRDFIDYLTGTTKTAYLTQLFYFGNIENKEWARQELYKTASNIKNEEAYQVLSTLTNSKAQQDKDFVRHLLRNSIKISRYTPSEKCFEVMRMLWCAHPIIEEDRDLVRPLLCKIAADQNDPNAIQAAIALFSNGNEDDKNYARPILHKAVNESSPETPYLADMLWFTENSTDKEAARKYFYATLAKNPTQAAILGKFLYHGTEEEKEFALPRLRKIISEDNFALNASFSLHQSLWHIPIEDIKESLRPRLHGIALNPDNPNMHGAIDCLWRSGNAQDREIAGKGLCYALWVGYTKPRYSPLSIFPHSNTPDRNLIPKLKTLITFSSAARGSSKNTAPALTKVSENPHLFLIIVDYVGAFEVETLDEWPQSYKKWINIYSKWNHSLC